MKRHLLVIALLCASACTRDASRPNTQADQHRFVLTGFDGVTQTKYADRVVPGPDDPNCYWITWRGSNYGPFYEETACHIAKVQDFGPDGVQK